MRSAAAASGRGDGAAVRAPVSPVDKDIEYLDIPAFLRRQAD